MSFKLIFSCPQPVDGTSVYRGWGPLTDLKLRHEGLELVEQTDPLRWITIRDCDAVFIQRPFVPGQVELAKFAKFYKKPIWIDYDDDLTCVTRDNPAARVYANGNEKNVTDNVKFICELADIVTVSTDVLKERLLKFAKRVITVPNGLDLDILQPMSPDLPQNPCVTWRGSGSHDRDVEIHAEAILEAHKAFPEWGWCFFGHDHWRLTERMNPARVRIVPFISNYVSFIMDMQKMRGALNIVPLADTPFNRAKSRIAQFETSLAGAVSIVPDWEEWRGGSAFHYDGVNGFKDALFRAMNTPLPELAEMNKNDWEWVMQNRTL